MNSLLNLQIGEILLTSHRVAIRDLATSDTGDVANQTFSINVFVPQCLDLEGV